MYKCHIIKLYPSKAQSRFFFKSCGVARFSYNWGIRMWQELYKNGQKPSSFTLNKIKNSLKPIRWPWMSEVGKFASESSIENLGVAFENFFAKKSKYPRFKKKGRGDSFVAFRGMDRFKQKIGRLWIPRLGWVKCAENLRFDGEVNKVTIKRTANLWFAVISIKTNEPPSVCDNQAIVGVDLGIKSMAVTSDGKVFANPLALRSRLKSLKRQQRRLSKKLNGSKNQFKQRMRVARLHYRISCVRKTRLHQVTSELVKNYGTIVIENLNVAGMVKNHHLAQALSDVSFGEFRRQLEYKCQWSGVHLVVADRFFASSKICSKCGIKHFGLTLNDRTFNCPSCGFTCDRDYNAALNLANLGRTQKSWESEACGEGSSSIAISNSPSMNQEVELLNNSLT